MSFGGKLVLTASEIASRNTVFRDRYADLSGSASFYNELEVPWIAFKEAACAQAAPDLLIIGLIHRYDAATSHWYLTAQQATFGGYTGPGLYPTTPTTVMFDIRPDGTIAAYSGGLQESGGQLYDPVYFAGVLEGGNAISPTTYVSGVAIAWEEIKQLHCDNKNHIPGADDALFSIRCCSVSADYTADIPQESLVPFPHAVGLYLCYNGVPCLDDAGTTGPAIFVNKAADFGSLTPPHNAVYSWPAGLIPKTC